ncbi:MAG: nuclear transport factor 2 family protein [Alphaproteobacteria bacterium]|nr:nuclear transport factor 2 family protein [Alphaproteobacteria bacterium]
MGGDEIPSPRQRHRICARSDKEAGSLLTLSLREAAARYVDVMQSVSAADLHRLREVCAPDFRLRDPFNDARGIDHVMRVFRQMFDELDEPTTTVTDVAFSATAFYLRWDFRFRRRNGPLATVVGMSEVHFNAEGLATDHRDYWDAG